MRTFLEWLAAAVLAGVLVACLAGCADEVVVPQEVVTPSWKQNETRPLFTSCTHAQIAGAPLPLVYGDPGWNGRLDADGDGRAC